MGIRGARLEKNSELDSKLPELLRSSKPILIDCIIPEEENVIPMVPGGKRLDQMVLS